MSKLLNIVEVMELFQVNSRQTIYNWIEEGKIPRPVKKWGSPRWNEEQIKHILTPKLTHDGMPD